MYTVYSHINKINSKIYVGITCQEPWTKRFNSKDGSGYKSCILFYNAIQKYGWNNFEHKILATCEEENAAKELERYYIALYKSNDKNFGYNIMEGGQTQRYPQSIKEKISKANKGKPSPSKGKVMSEEQKRKISEAQKGRPFTPEHAANCKKAMREYFKTHKPSHTFTAEDHAKSKELTMKKVRIVELDKIFNSMTECAKFMNVNISNLSNAIKANRKYKGYHIEKVCS